MKGRNTDYPYFTDGKKKDYVNIKVVTLITSVIVLDLRGIMTSSPTRNHHWISFSTRNFLIYIQRKCNEWLFSITSGLDPKNKERREKKGPTSMKSSNTRKYKSQLVRFDHLFLTKTLLNKVDISSFVKWFYPTNLNKPRCQIRIDFKVLDNHCQI